MSKDESLLESKSQASGAAQIVKSDVNSNGKSGAGSLPGAADSNLGFFSKTCMWLTAGGARPLRFTGKDINSFAPTSF